MNAGQRLRWRSRACPKLPISLPLTTQAPMPTKVEDVDKFMQDLAAAASGRRLPEDELEGARREPARI